MKRKELELLCREALHLIETPGDFSERDTYEIMDRLQVAGYSYESRVRELEAEGMTRSDAQAVADAEKL